VLKIVNDVGINIFEYYTQQEAELFAYYSIPKELFTNSRYKSISTDAKLLYGLLRDRNQLSIKNGWVDNEGHIYIIFTREEAEELLNAGNQKVNKLFKELNEVKLIKDVRQGLNKPNLIYVGKIIPDNRENLRKCENHISGDVKNTSQEISKSHANNTDNNNTNMSNKDQSVSLLVQQKEPIDRPTDILPDDTALQKELERILHNGQVYLYQAKLFIESVIKKLYTDGQMPYILKMGLTHQEIKSRLRLLTYKHIDVALTKMRNVRSNKELYFAKCLLTAIVEVDLDEVLADAPVEEEKREPSTQQQHKQDNFEQREDTDEELEHLYANLAKDDSSGKGLSWMKWHDNEQSRDAPAVRSPGFSDG
jgi:hypothetical protein